VVKLINNTLVFEHVALAMMVWATRRRCARSPAQRRREGIGRQLFAAQ
jgi:hypothetical protein